jgi:DNA mismatch repair protein MSH6
VNYLDSDKEREDDDEQISHPGLSRGRSRTSKRVRTSPDSSDEFQQDGEDGQFLDDDMDDFIAPDESEEEARPSKKRKKASKGYPQKLTDEQDFLPDEEVFSEVPDSTSGTT